jgi:hypothetical protein
MKSRKRAFSGSLLLLAITLGLTACGPQNGTQRPDDQVLKKGIAQLIQTFESKYPQLKNWDDSAVKDQLVGKLPVGVSSEAGWHLTWPHATDKQLSQVFVPWSLIGQMPETFPADTSHYSGGRNVPSSVVQDIRRQFLLMAKVGDYFSAITNVRYSTANSKYIIFESIPYLPVTDPAYGWASATTGAWKVIDYGTATVGCGSVPGNVQSEFGFSCP